MLTARIKHWSRYELILYFLTYSFLGWLLETSVILIEHGYLDSRGFVFGPFCVIYGFGALLLITTVNGLMHKPLIHFFISIILITILEYFTGFALEAIFHKRWWDYSTLSFNLNGYVSLKNSLLWGILALFVSKYLHPNIEILYKKLPPNKASLISLLTFIFFITNILLSILHNI